MYQYRTNQYSQVTPTGTGPQQNLLQGTISEMQ